MAGNIPNIERRDGLGIHLCGGNHRAVDADIADPAIFIRTAVLKAVYVDRCPRTALIHVGYGSGIDLDVERTMIMSLDGDCIPAGIFPFRLIDKNLAGNNAFGGNLHAAIAAFIPVIQDSDADRIRRAGQSSRVDDNSRALISSRG